MSRHTRIWDQERARLYLRCPFIGTLAAGLPLIPVVDERVVTTWTNEHAIHVNALLLERMDEEQRAYLLAHEVWHIALAHAQRGAGCDAGRWHRAADHEVNSLLIDLGFTCPAEALPLLGAPGRQAEQVYAWLGTGADAEPIGIPGARDWRMPDPRADLAGRRDPAFRDGEGHPAPTVRGRLGEALRRHGAELPATVREMVESHATGVVDWRRALVGFLREVPQGGSAWYPPSRRHLHAGRFLPSRRGRALDIAVAIDVSASTAGHAIACWTELRALFAVSERPRIRVLQCDDAIRDDRIISDLDPDPCSGLPRHRGSRSDLRPVFARLAQDAPPDLLICCTDGRSALPGLPPGHPVLWLLMGSSVQEPPQWPGGSLRIRPIGRGVG